jgi:hypothetical protein
VDDVGTVRTFRGVRIDTIIWLGLSLVLFAISAWMTYWITKVERTPQQRGVAVTFFDAATTPRLPAAVFSVKERGMQLDVDGIEARLTTIRIGAFQAPAWSGVTCTTIVRTIAPSWAAATADEAPMSPPITGKPLPQSLVLALGAAKQQTVPQPTARSLQQDADIQAEQAARMSGTTFVPHDKSAAQLAAADRSWNAFLTGLRATDHVTCDLPIDVAHDTYTSRSFDVAVSEGLADTLVIPGRQTTIFPRQVALHDDDAQEIHVTNRASGTTLLASSATGPYLGYDTQDLHHPVVLHFEWDSVSATSWRDIYITVIGTLIALGAAALIEACRPYVEKLVKVEPKT